eukprot:GHRR01019196.1.p1 GENE.GHRR01019196.1~~GHRR01019196.1.p1  ORF type:complete len:129 (-),score=17.58 GHRR01019196.1:1114-1500(-)
MWLALYIGMVNLRFTGPSSARNEAPNGFVRVSLARIDRLVPPASFLNLHFSKWLFSLNSQPCTAALPGGSTSQCTRVTYAGRGTSTSRPDAALSAGMSDQSRSRTTALYSLAASLSVVMFSLNGGRSP